MDRRRPSNEPVHLMYGIRSFLATVVLALALTPGKTAPVVAGGDYVPTSSIRSLYAPVELSSLVLDVPAPLRVRREAIERVLAHEGGYSAHPMDSGGPTNYGITRATARHHGYRGDMRHFTRDDAVRVYASLWDDYGMGTIPDPEVAAQAFDAVVAHGPRGLKWIRDGPGACEYINHRRMTAYQNSKGWSSFHRGWTKRINRNLEMCHNAKNGR